ncbi:hypothetical protein [Aeromicrobium sp. UC242_57]|uniref:hypothetical protein n=1 Tax=Aeromicrobium sp. UC242_57 TaxID=3374624 RepID=UPI00378F3695
MSTPDSHARPDGVGDATVEALGKVSEALEVVEEARGACCTPSTVGAARQTSCSARQSAASGGRSRHPRRRNRD